MKLLLLATDNLDKTITVLVDNVKYEYWIRGDFAGVERQVWRLLHAGAPGKIINLLKASSSRCDRLT